MTTLKMAQHFIDRAKERYGLSFVLRDVTAINRICQAGGGVLVASGYGTKPKEVRLVEYAGTVLPIVWHKRDQRVVTVLPKGYSLRPGAGKRRARRESIGWR